MNKCLRNALLQCEIPKIQIGKGNMETTLWTEPTIFVHKFICFCLFLQVTLSAKGLADCKTMALKKGSNFPVRPRSFLFKHSFSPQVTIACTLGYSDFHNLMGFTSKKMPNNILFVYKVFQFIKPFLANLHSTISKKYSYMYSMTPKFLISFLTYEYQKNAKFYADFKSVEII